MRSSLSLSQVIRECAAAPVADTEDVFGDFMNSQDNEIRVIGKKTARFSHLFSPCPAEEFRLPEEVRRLKCVMFSSKHTEHHLLLAFHFPCVDFTLPSHFTC